MFEKKVEKKEEKKVEKKFTKKDEQKFPPLKDGRSSNRPH